MMQKRPARVKKRVTKFWTRFAKSCSWSNGWFNNRVFAAQSMRHRAPGCKPLTFNEIPAESVIDQISELRETIAEGIASRGFFALMDQQRLDLICGAGTLHNLDSREVRLKVQQFADANGWDVTSNPLGVIFWPKQD